MEECGTLQVPYYQETVQWEAWSCCLSRSNCCPDRLNVSEETVGRKVFISYPWNVVPYGHHPSSPSLFLSAFVLKVNADLMYVILQDWKMNVFLFCSILDTEDSGMFFPWFRCLANHFDVCISFIIIHGAYIMILVVHTERRHWCLIHINGCNLCFINDIPRVYDTCMLIIEALTILLIRSLWFVFFWNILS